MDDIWTIFLVVPTVTAILVLAVGIAFDRS